MAFILIIDVSKNEKNIPKFILNSNLAWTLMTDWGLYLENPEVRKKKAGRSFESVLLLGL